MSQYDQFILQQNLQKKKDAQQRQADAQSLHTYNQALASLYKGTNGGTDASPNSNAYDAAKAKEAERAKLGILKEQMAEQEAKWKEEYDALMEENAKLKKQGEDALQAAQWQERYEAAVKEKDEAMANIEKEKEDLMKSQQMEAAKLKEREKLSSQLFLQAVTTAQREKEKYEAALKEKDEAMEALQKERDNSNHSSNQSTNAGEMVAEQDGPSCADDFIDDIDEPSSVLSDKEGGDDLAQCADDHEDTEGQKRGDELAQSSDDHDSIEDKQHEDELAESAHDDEEVKDKEHEDELAVSAHDDEDVENKDNVDEFADCADDYGDIEDNGHEDEFADCADDYDDIEVDEEAGITKGVEIVAEEDPPNRNRRCFIIIGALVCIVIIVVAIVVPISVVGGKKSEPNNYIAQNNSICGRSIPIDLSDRSTWLTPSTPTLFQADYDLTSITLVKDDAPYGSVGIQLNAFFRAFDYSHDTRLPLYITQDNYFFRTGFFKLFMGGYNKDESFWELLEGILGAKIVENEAALNRQGYYAPEHKSPEELNEYVGDELVATQIRNHRDTILRKLFQYPTLTGGDEDVCSLIQSEGPSKKYTVVHLSDEKTNSLLKKLERSTGLDHSAAVEMSPEYVTAFLKPLKMLNSDIYPIATGEYDRVDTSVAERVQALLNDYVLGDLIRLPKENRHLGSVLYFAVLADVYIGNPVDHNSMWIARMRCALGLCSTTFILTKKQLIDWKAEWVSYVNQDNYLELYDREVLGLWSG